MPGLGMRHLQRASTAFAGSVVGVERASLRRPFDGEARPTEHQEVEIELARAPALARRRRPNVALEILERDEEVGRAGRRVGAGRDVERDDRVAEVGLVGDADRGGRVQARDAAETDAGQGGHAPRPRRSSVARRRRRSPRGRCRRGLEGAVIAAPAPPTATARLARMRPVAVRILHPDPGPCRRPHRALGRRRTGERRRAPSGRVRGRRARTTSGSSPGRPTIHRSDARLRDLVRADRPAGLVILGSGAIPLATAGDRREFVAVRRVRGSAGPREQPLLGRHRRDRPSRRDLADVPDLAGDNALPRWLDEVAGYAVGDLRRRWRLAVDIDGPLDVVLTGGFDGAESADAAAVDLASGLGRAWRRSVGSTADPHGGAARRRADVGRDASSGSNGGRHRGREPSSRSAACGRGSTGQRPGRVRPRGVARSRRARARFGDHLARLGDAALVDTPRPAGPSARRRGSGLAAAGGSVRLGPAARGPRRRPVAARPDRVGRRRADPGPARRPHAGRTGRAAGGRARPSAISREAPMEMTPGLRREPAPDLEAVGEDEDARRADPRGDPARRPDAIRRFMDLALYDPDGGYYRGPEARPGRTGDFLTAPEAHPIFGRAVARVLDEAWRRLGEPERFVLREYGAGDGHPGAGHPRRPPARRVGARRGALRYDPVEVEARRIDAVESRLAEAGFDDTLLPARASAGRRSSGRSSPTRSSTRCRSIGSAVATAPSSSSPSASTTTGLSRWRSSRRRPALAARLASEGDRARRRPDRRDLPRARRLGRGRRRRTRARPPAAHRLRPRRDRPVRPGPPARRHAPGVPPPPRPRRPVPACRSAGPHRPRRRHGGGAGGGRGGLAHLATTTQAEFLVGAGTDELLRAIQADPATSLEAYLEVRSALMRLLDPAAMGRFRVMAFGRDWPSGPPLAAFAFRLPPRAARASNDASRETSPDHT